VRGHWLALRGGLCDEDQAQDRRLNGISDEQARSSADSFNACIVGYTSRFTR
jgi:hypothetical protein